MKNKLKALVTHNIGLKVVSLLLGVLIWASLSNTNDPITTKTLNIPVIFQNEELLLSDESLMVLSAPETVQITVSTRNSKKSKATADLFRCTADLTDHIGGDYSSQRVHINVTQISGTDIVLDWNYFKNDPNVTVVMDEYIEKVFPVQFLAQDSLTEGLILENSISFDPATVKVSGPKSKFGNVAGVKAIVNLQELSQGGGGVFEKQVRLQLYDSNDNVIPNSDGQLEMTVQDATMNATVTRIQTVSVIVGGTVGNTAEGYRYVSSSASPSSISVHGLKSSVADLTELTIPADQIDITGIDKDSYYVIDIKPLLPEGVSLAEGDGLITVTINVEHLETENYAVPSSQIDLFGKNEDLIYEVADTTLNVKVKGFKEDLEVLKADSLKLTVDVSSMAPGTHRLPVKVEDKNGYIMENSGMIYVNVSISEKAEPVTEPEETEPDTEPEDPGKETDPAEESSEPSESSSQEESSSHKEN